MPIHRERLEALTDATADAIAVMDHFKHQIRTAVLAIHTALDNNDLDTIRRVANDLFDRLDSTTIHRDSYMTLADERRRLAMTKRRNDIGKHAQRAVRAGLHTPTPHPRQATREPLQPDMDFLAATSAGARIAAEQQDDRVNAIAAARRLQEIEAYRPKAKPQAAPSGNPYVHSSEAMGETVTTPDPERATAEDATAALAAWGEGTSLDDGKDNSNGAKREG